MTQQIDYDCSRLADLYKRFADENVNIISSSIAAIPDELGGGIATVVVLEYSYERPRDGKLIWPKIAVDGESLYEAIYKALKTVKAIRGE
jgi:hypothetical protein